MRYSIISSYTQIYHTNKKKKIRMLTYTPYEPQPVQDPLTVGKLHSRTASFNSCICFLKIITLAKITY